VQDVVKSNGKGLGVISNRTGNAEDVTRLGSTAHETHALSNAAYGDRSWPKVVNGETWTRDAIRASVAAKESREELVERLLKLLSTNTMPKQKENEKWDMYMNQLRHSIFIPAIGRDGLEEMKMPKHDVGDVVKQKAVDAQAGCYGTEKQSVVLVDREGLVLYVERTLFDREARPVEVGKGDRRFEFQIEGW
jgi:uncharacterized protein with NRDE domain